MIVEAHLGVFAHPPLVSSALAVLHERPAFLLVTAEERRNERQVRCPHLYHLGDNRISPLHEGIQLSVERIRILALDNPLLRIRPLGCCHLDTSGEVLALALVAKPQLYRNGLLRCPSPCSVVNNT